MRAFGPNKAATPSALCALYASTNWIAACRTASPSAGVPAEVSWAIKVRSETSASRARQQQQRERKCVMAVPEIGAATGDVNVARRLDDPIPQRVCQLSDRSGGPAAASPIYFAPRKFKIHSEEARHDDGEEQPQAQQG